MARLGGAVPSETEEPSYSPDDGGQAEIRTFLIADVRGYTLFTQQRGDEAAAKLAARFAQIVREEVPGRGGVLLELRGDEALTVFASPRQAIRAAVDLQDRFVEETLADPNIPLAVGIGLDAGEAVRVEGGYRGGALNLAARLCGRAGPGEILASNEVTHLARRVEGVRYVDRGVHEFKGLTDPVRVVKVEAETGDPAALLRQALPTGEPVRRPWVPQTLRSRLIAAAVAVALVAAGVFAVRQLTGGDGTVDANTVGLIDASSGSVVDSIQLTPGRGGLASGEGAVWAAGSRAGTVVRIDPSTRAVVDTIEVSGQATAITTSPGAVWVAIGDQGTVERINPSTNTKVNAVRVGNGPAGIAWGFGAIWVANRLDGTVSRIDPQTTSAGDPIPAGVSPAGVATAAGFVWVTNTDAGTVTRIDPKSFRSSEKVAVGNGPVAVAGSGDAVWVLNGADGTVSRIDPSTNTVVATVQVGEEPVALAIAGGGVWVATEVGGAVSRIDPGSNRVTEVVDVQGAPQGLTAVGGLVWVATGAVTGAHRGGTLTVVSSGPPDSIDPVVAYSSDSWSILHHTNDGLVGYRKVGGQEGATLVADLATSLPEPTDAGRTYTFTLRRGVRYSTGALVRASDVRASIARGLKAPESPGAGYFEPVIGASECQPGSEVCDLRRGIEVNDPAGTVTFHLSRPDPDFLYKLSMPFAFVLPADVPPAGEGSNEPLPATGPYMIASFAEGRLEMVRNPRFRVWSRVAQPDGNPDRIVWRIGLDPEEMTDLVQEGGADWMLESPPASRLQQLRTQYTDRIHAYPNPVVLGMSFNTRVPPFDDENVRRAVNYAVDRRTVAAFFGEARITCQILPPNFPGYRPYCPYKSDPDPETEWTAPDLAKARQLVEAAGVEGSEVTVWAMVDQPQFDFIGLGRYTTSLLRDLGFRAKLRVSEDPGKHFDLVANSRTRAQLFAVGWFADLPAPSNFLDFLFGCDSFVPNDRFNSNYAELCDPRIDALIDRAYELQLSDPSAAGAAWADVDKAIVDTAAWLPVVNPLSIDFLSERVGNYQRHPQWGLLLGQLWVR
jgi:YVTN family beta-propeller protein